MLSILICEDIEANPGLTDHEISLKISAIVDTLLERTNGTEQMIKTLTTSVTTTKSRLEAKVETLQSHVHALEQNIYDLENKERRRNLIIYGLNENTNENPSTRNDVVLK